MRNYRGRQTKEIGVYHRADGVADPIQIGQIGVVFKGRKGPGGRDDHVVISKELRPFDLDFESSRL